MPEASTLEAAKQFGSPWAPLRHPIFFALFIAQLVSNIGTLMQNVGSAWLMGDLHASPTLVALVQSATFLPVLFFGIPSGVLADIADRRKLILLTQTWMMSSSVVLTALSFAHRVTPGILLALTFTLGLGNALNGPAWQAIQPDLVPREDVPQAIALGTLTFNVGRAVGPALGGLLIAAAGAPWVFLINAISFLGVVFVVARWRAPKAKSLLPVESFAGATKACLRYGANAPILRGVLFRTALFFLPGSALSALLPVVVRERLHLQSGGYGVLLATFGIGAAISAVIRPRVARRWSSDALVVRMTLLAIVVTITVGVVRNAWVVGVALFVGGFAWTLAVTATNVAAQSALASWVRARGLGLYMISITGSVSLGSALWGLVAEWSLVGAYLVAAGFLLVGLLFSSRWKLGAVAGIDVTPVPAIDPIVTLVPQASDGPVVVTVAYLVPDTDVAVFTHTMKAVERYRRRTGAYRWGLFRDLATPNRFLEIFHVESWLEHLRQHHRTTASFDGLFDSVRGYLDGEMPVQHLLSAYSPGATDHLAPDARAAEEGDAE